MPLAPKQRIHWRSPAELHQPLVTSRFALEPLHDRHAELDFAALMSCRARLRAELQWGEWPPEDFTLEANRADLRDHHGEFVRGEAFAYTVLSPDRASCIGCIYIERCPEISGAQLAFWLVDAAIQLEEHLVTDILQWIHTSWRIDRVLIPLRESNTRGIALAQKLDLAPEENLGEGPLAALRCFLSESDIEAVGR